MQQIVMPRCRFLKREEPKDLLSSWSQSSSSIEAAQVSWNDIGASPPTSLHHVCCTSYPMQFADVLCLVNWLLRWWWDGHDQRLVGNVKREGGLQTGDGNV
jgi:hypothetical protein